MNETLKGQKLTCIRGDKQIFSNLEFELSAGSAVILSGANGSGKSSLIKIIAGLLSAQSGSLSVNGENILGNKDWISHNICYLAHKNALKPEMTVAENLTFWAKMGYFRGDIALAAAKIGIDHCLDLPVCYLSSGQARRAALMRLLCHPAPIWLLDEPAVGLDTQGGAMLANMMNDHLHQGGKILAATHLELGIDHHKSRFLNMADFSFNPITGYDISALDFGEDLL